MLFQELCRRIGLTMRYVCYLCNALFSFNRPVEHKCWHMCTGTSGVVVLRKDRTYPLDEWCIWGVTYFSGWSLPGVPWHKYLLKMIKKMWGWTYMLWSDHVWIASNITEYTTEIGILCLLSYVAMLLCCCLVLMCLIATAHFFLIFLLTGLQSIR